MAASPNPVPLTHRQVFWTMAGVMLAMFLGALDQTVVGIAMPKIIADLGGFNQYAWVTSIYMVTSAVTIPIVGKLTDMYGRKSFYIGGIIIFVLASVACGLGQNMTQLIIFRGVQGIGAGAMMANAFTVIGDLFPPAERGKYQGFISGVWALSSVIGPTIGGFLTDQISWHWVFFVNVPLGILAVAIFVKFFPKLHIVNLKHIVDYSGLVTLILTVVPAMLALSWGGVVYAWKSPQILGMFALAAVMLVFFILIETRAKEPILPLSLFKNRIVAISNVVTFLTSLGMFGAVAFIPLFFQGILGVSATRSGNLMIPMSASVMVASFIGGQLISRSGGRYRILGIVGTAFICLGVFLLSRLTTSSGYLSVILAIIFVGLGMGCTMPVFTLAVQNAVPYNMLGVATSSTTFIRSLGGAVGLAVLGSIMNNRFLTDFISQIPENIKNSVPMNEIITLAHNPQALVSQQAQESLKQMLSQGTSDPAVYGQVMHVLREALSSAITQAFLIGFIVSAAGLVAAFFLKEIPMREDHPRHAKHDLKTKDPTPKTDPTVTS
jgi:EmrB/QacA subfamily drug resistance transporter